MEQIQIHKTKQKKNKFVKPKKMVKSEVRGYIGGGFRYKRERIRPLCVNVKG